MLRNRNFFPSYAEIAPMVGVGHLDFAPCPTPKITKILQEKSPEIHIPSSSLGVLFKPRELPALELLGQLCYLGQVTVSAFHHESGDSTNK